MKHKLTLAAITAFTAIISASVVSCTQRGSSSVPAYTSGSTTTTGTTDTAHATAQLANPAPGRQLFEVHCKDCHGMYGSQQNNGAADLTHSRLDSLGIVQTIQNGRGTMPPFRYSLHDSDLAHLEVYVKSIRQ